MTLPLSDLLEKTYDRYWKGTRGERTAYANALDVIDILGPSLSTHKLAPQHIDQLVNVLEKRGLAPATINRKLAALSKMLGYAKNRGIQVGQVVLEYKREPEGRIRWLNETEEAAILAYFNEHHPVMGRFVTLAIDTGLRVGELLSLEPSNIVDGWVCLKATQTKTHKSRRVPLTPRALRLVKQCPKMGKLFPDLNHAKVSYGWERMKTALNLTHDKELVPHCLRHTFCSRLIQRGVPLEVVKDLAGHSRLTTTLRYAHLNPSNLLDAIAKIS